MDLNGKRSSAGCNSVVHYSNKQVRNFVAQGVSHLQKRFPVAARSRTDTGVRPIKLQKLEDGCRGTGPAMPAWASTELEDRLVRHQSIQSNQGE